ncbi:hypothetical protein MZM54_25145 [[Brevibacterium] frigoritolerans]|nr:hypothetical protein [Peribacillus frigoritolerans]
MAPPTPDTVTATHAIQPNFIIIESAYIFKNNRIANFDIHFISAEDNGDSILCGVYFTGIDVEWGASSERVSL